MQAFDLISLGVLTNLFTRSKNIFNHSFRDVYLFFALSPSIFRKINFFYFSWVFFISSLYHDDNPTDIISNRICAISLNQAFNMYQLSSILFCNRVILSFLKWLIESMQCEVS